MADSAAFMALRAAASTPAPFTRRCISIIGVPTSPSRANRYRDTLHDSSVVMASRVHAIVDGEITTNQVRAHCRVLAGKHLCLADSVCLVFAIIDAHHAGVASGTGVSFVQRVRPAAASAETCIKKRLLAVKRQVPP